MLLFFVKTVVKESHSCELARVKKKKKKKKKMKKKKKKRRRRNILSIW